MTGPDTSGDPADTPPTPLDADAVARLVAPAVRTAYLLAVRRITRP